MRREQLRGGLTSLGGHLRQLAAFGCLILAIRLMWLAGGDALAHAKNEMDPESNATNTQTPLEDVREKIEDPNNPQRPDFQKLKEKLEGQGVKKEEEPEIPTAELRKILVDVGPPRSEVFIGRQRMGQTPFVGQFSCTLGDKVQIRVLPPQGVPIVRNVICRGKTVTVKN